MTATWTILEGDCRDRLRELPTGSVHTCITSPPYFGLRDYGTGEWEGGDADCDHMRTLVPRGLDDPGIRRSTLDGGKRTIIAQSEANSYRETCGKCGARRIDRQLGLEQTPDEFVTALVSVFREVRRVLRDDGTVWLNLGDSYAGSYGNQGRKSERGTQRSINGEMLTPVLDGRYPDSGSCTGAIPPGADYKAKDLLGVPWLVAFALCADGWYLRSDIIWHKPNPMPESVTDRPTKAHEYVFLLSKSARYFYDADAIREGFADERQGNPGAYDRTTQQAKGANNDRADLGFLNCGGGWNADGTAVGRNKRSVWTVATQPYAGAHFAVFPPKLIEPCVLAGCPERACGVCGAPWVRVVERLNGKSWHDHADDDGTGQRQVKMGQASWDAHVPPRTLGFESFCPHDDGTASGVVLDPFAGAGTTGLVALRHNRSFVGIELNPAYAEMARERIRDDAPLLNCPTEVAT